MPSFEERPREKYDAQAAWISAIGAFRGTEIDEAFRMPSEYDELGDAGMFLASTKMMTTVTGTINAANAPKMRTGQNHGSSSATTW